MTSPSNIANKNIKSSSERNISTLSCVVCGIVLALGGFFPVLFTPTHEQCNSYTDVQNCIIKSDEIRELLKPLPPIGFGLGFFGSWIIQWKINNMPENQNERKTAI